MKTQGIEKSTLKKRTKNGFSFALFLTAVAFFTISFAGHSQVGSTTSALLGNTSYADDCSPEYQAFNEKMMMFGRIAVASKAFEQCVNEKVRALYKKCNNDPFYDASIDIQIQKVIAVARSINNVHIKCTGGAGNASASIEDYGKISDEAFSWGGWFSDVYAQLGKRKCNSGEKPEENNCRYDDYPWPYTQGAGIIWHEAMHQQGYTHGASDQENAITACGYEEGDSWHFAVNTMPYIIQNCISEVLMQSARLGDIDSCPGSNQLKIVSQYNGRSLECINDPGKKGLGILALENNQLTDKAIKPDGDWIGGWHLGTDNTVVAKGDFNGDNTEDFIVTSRWGIGILTHDGETWRPLVVKPNGTRFGGWNFQSRDNKIVDVGDFNGDGKDDIVITSPWGIGILSLRGDTLTALVAKPNGTRFDGWNFQSRDNKIHGIGDFNNDRKDDILITSDWGIGILTLNGSSLSALLVKPSGTRFGGWNFQTKDNKIGGIGDFNGDNKDDIIISSNWGISLLTIEGPSLTTIMIKPNETRFGGWNFQSADHSIKGIGDFNGDNKDDILITNTWGLGILELNGDSLNSIVVKPNGTRFGGWNYQSKDNVIRGIGDFNGDRKDDIIITSPWGLGILSVSGSSLTSLDIKPNGKLFGSWLLDRTDDIALVGSFSNARNAKILVHKKR
ncbi:FG-GAP repeat domain-containing protein [Maribacter sp. IgM3_T14_3]|uniref:FG-GAP repeat domain-containing protein n=1 Tax=Maribacter sp. IgM3_T14_3 TaxID=3415140 RepID=UPI003C700A0E